MTTNKIKELDKSLRVALNEIRAELAGNNTALQAKLNAITRLQETLFWLQILSRDEQQEESAAGDDDLVPNQDAPVDDIASWNHSLCNFDSEGTLSLDEMKADCIKYRIPYLIYNGDVYAYRRCAVSGNHEWQNCDHNSETYKRFTRSVAYSKEYKVPTMTQEQDNENIALATLYCALMKTLLHK